MKPSIEEITAPSRGFPPNMRVLHSSGFQAVYASGTRYYTKYFVVVVAASAPGKAGREACRLGVTVSKKVHKRANKRNHIKRRVREWFRNHAHLLNEPCDIAVIARSGAVGCTYAAVVKQLSGCLRYHKKMKTESE